MSLVNEMLRDLDKRRRSSPQSQAHSGLRAPAPGLLQSASLRPLRPLGILVLVLVGAAGLWFYTQPSSWPSAPSEPVASIPASIPATTPDLTASESIAVINRADSRVQIIGVEWTRQPLLELQLTLNQAPAQRVLVSASRTLNLDLGPIDSALALPAPGSALIRSAEFVTNNGHLTLSLETQQDASFRVAALTSNNQHRLTLRITPQPRSAPKPQSTQQPAPQPQPSLQSQAVTAKVPSVAADVEVARPVTVRSEKARAEKIRVSGLSLAAAVSAQAESTGIPTPPVSWRKTAPQSLAQRDQAAVDQALEKVQSHQLADAQQVLETLLRQEPLAFSSRTLLATLSIGAQQLDRAQQLIAEGLTLDPNHPGLRKLSARQLIQWGALPAAIDMLNNNRPEVKEDPEFHQLRAAALQAAGEHQQAAEAYHSLLRIRADKPRWWIGLALSLEALKKPEQAKHAYKNVFKIPQVAPELTDFVRQRLVQLGG
ncbi:MAG: hypothetical protein ACJAWL_001543 [Motiliproteus sp.]|jgi:hypothetical protein